MFATLSGLLLKPPPTFLIIKGEWHHHHDVAPAFNASSPAIMSVPIIEHFDIPDPLDIAAKYPEEFKKFRELTDEIEGNYGFQLKEFQHEDIARLLFKSETDLAQIPVYSAAPNRLGFALQLCTLRFMGFIPDDLTNTPPTVVEYLAGQLDVDPESLALYGTRAQSHISLSIIN